MTISLDLEAQILRLYHVEQWRVGTIARQLGVHHGTVDRVLAQAGLPKSGRAQRASLIDPFVPLVVETLTKYPRLNASRLYAMVCQRGYQGGPDHFRHLVAHYRPRHQPEAYHRLRTLPGEQGQVDWGHFGKVTIGRAHRTLMAFVMVLSYSRQIFLRFYLDAQMANFLRGHEAAFAAWQGLPRVLLYDNLKTAVLERQGEAIRFHPTLLSFAAHYRFEPRPVAVARGNEKGRVERAIRYVRENFFAARDWRDLDDLNAQAQTWCAGPAAARPCPEDRSWSVGAAFAQEQPRLLAPPDNPFPTDEWVAGKAGKTPYVRFDRNDYSIPHTHVQRPLTVVASPTQVRILAGAEVIATHPRSYDQAAQIEQPDHLEALTAVKRQARYHRGQDRLAQATPASRQWLSAAAERGQPLGAITAALLELLEQYGAAELEAAIMEALQQDVPHPNAVRLSLQRRREQRGQPPPLALALPADHRVRDIVVRPHALQDYDQLQAHPERNTPMTTPNESLRARAQALKLYGLLAHWHQIADADWLEPLIQWEEHERAQRSLERRLGHAHLGRFKPLADFDWHWPSQCDRAAIEDLMRLHFLHEPANAVLVGPNGVGKSTLARNIAYQAVLQGHTVLFTTAAQMLNELAAQDGDNALRRRLALYARPQLLVIDEVGYLSYSNRHADLLFEIVSRRYEHKATLITTNRPFAEWGEVFPNAACVVSLIDRLVHHAEIITIDGPSYRLKEAKERTERRQQSRAASPSSHRKRPTADTQTP